MDSILTKIVPNQFPTIHNQPYRIAIIGESPGADEVEQGIPFCGHSGRLLTSMLSGAGILRDACFIGNICQQRPPSNDIKAFKLDGPEITSGINVLKDDLIRFNPHLVLVLGGTALWWAKGHKESIDSWRGSLFINRHGHKTLPTIHPAAALREYSYTPLLRFDLRRAAEEGRFPELVLPKRNLDTTLSVEEAIFRLDSIPDGAIISPDIEGYWNNLKMCSIAVSATDSFIINFQSNCDIQTECRLWRAFARVMSSAKIGKIFQNGLYELFVLEYGYKIPVLGLVDDTMLKHWQLYCELPKALDFQASIYTREPFWKDEKMYQSNRQSLMEGCCIDSAVTYEINDVLSKQLTGPPLIHYKQNIALLEPILFMELNGINYDRQKAQTKLKETHHQINRLQWVLNELAGYKRLSKEEWFLICKDRFCFVRDQSLVLNLKDILPHCKTTSLHLASEAIEILSGEAITIATQGRLSTLTETCLNVDSSTQLPEFLFRTLQFPVQYKKIKGRLTDKETTDQVALLTIFKKTSDPILKLILTLRSLKTRTETLSATTDPDGRIRCGYNIVGSETGRLSCYESPTGSGFNLQTVTKKDRDLFVPDPGYWMFQCDLSGADGWTVAAWCKACGDSTMLDDFLFGLKPAKNNVLIYRHGRQVLSWSREKLKEEGKAIDSDGWEYFACKKVAHGVNYGMGAETISKNILKDSYKMFGDPILVEPSVCEELKRHYITRYSGVLLWHDKIKRQLKQYGYIISACGHKRTFFGRRDDHETFRQAAAHEPQLNTTYATNTALLRLWKDDENRLQMDNIETEKLRMESILRSSDNRSGAPSSIQVSERPPQPEESRSLYHHTNRLLRIKPLHHIHDAILGQFKKEDTEWAVRKIREWFNNSFVIAGTEIVIPFEGSWGTSWGNLKEGHI